MTVLVITGIFLLINLIAKKHVQKHKVFFKALTADMQVRFGNGTILPTNIQESMSMLYPYLPKFDKCFEIPVKQLAEMVEWTIDPNKYGLHISPKKIKKRKK